jgi:hypothetical protein
MHKKKVVLFSKVQPSALHQFVGQCAVFDCSFADPCGHRVSMILILFPFSFYLDSREGTARERVYAYHTPRANARNPSEVVRTWYAFFDEGSTSHFHGKHLVLKRISKCKRGDWFIKSWWHSYPRRSRTWNFNHLADNTNSGTALKIKRLSEE